MPDLTLKTENQQELESGVRELYPPTFSTPFDTTSHKWAEY